MEDDLKKNGRRPKRKNEMEDDLNLFISNGRRPQKNGRQPQKKQKAFFWHTTNQPNWLSRHCKFT